LCAAAAVATLELVETTDACARAEATAETLRTGMRRILIEERIPWGVYGESSAFVIFPNPGRVAIDPATFDPLVLGFKGIKGARDASLINRLRLAMLANGVDIMGGPGGVVSATHGPREVESTLEAFRTTVRWLRAEGDIAAPA
jgi:glutamate-1-semialdehyde 2,1-aminomutase